MAGRLAPEPIQVRLCRMWNLHQALFEPQRWCRARYGQAPSRACFTGLLSAAQWLVHGAINQGMTPTQVKKAKRAIEELFLATFRGLAPTAD